MSFNINQNINSHTAENTSVFDVQKFRFSDKKKKKFYDDLSILVSSGIDLKSILELIEAEADKKYDKQLYSSIKKQIESGKSLSESMEHLKVFSDYECFSVKIGEKTGKLDKVLKDLAENFGQKLKLKQMVVRALTYPFIVLLIAFGIMYFMLQVVIPIFADFFKQNDKDLPDITKFIIKLSNNLDSYVLYFCIFLVGLFAIHFFLKENKNYKKTISGFLVRIPFIGRLIKEIQLARFTGMLAFLTKSQVGIIESLTLIQSTISFYPLKSTFYNVKDEIIKGNSLSNSLSNHKIYDKRLVSLIKFGEHTNNLGELSDELSTQYSQSVEHKTKIIGTIVEPLLIVFIACLVAFMMFAIYVPMSEMNTLIE